MSDQYKQIYEGVMEGDRVAVQDGVNAALEAGLNAEEILNKGQSVIYLVPEISLTHQLVDVLRNRFDCGCADFRLL